MANASVEHKKNQGTNNIKSAYFKYIFYQKVFFTCIELRQKHCEYKLEIWSNRWISVMWNNRIK